MQDRLQEDFRALGADVVFALLLLAFSGVTVDRK